MEVALRSVASIRAWMISMWLAVILRSSSALVVAAPLPSTSSVLNTMLFEQMWGVFITTLEPVTVPPQVMRASTWMGPDTPRSGEMSNRFSSTRLSREVSVPRVTVPTEIAPPSAPEFVSIPGTRLKSSAWNMAPQPPGSNRDGH